MALTGKTCLITGASRGIGAAIATRFASEGASLVLVARQQPLLRQVADRCIQSGARSAKTFQVDLADQKDVRAFVASLLSSPSDAMVDVLVNNAGILSKDNCLAGDVDQWVDVFSLNVLTPMRLTRAFAEGMKSRKSGAIVNLCGVAGVKGFKGMGVYCSTKFALKGWTSACAEELRPYGIPVVSLEPSYVDTDMIAGMKIPKKMMALPESIADQALDAVLNNSAATRKVK